MKPPRNQLKRRYGPGIWEDKEGGLHFSLPELLAMAQLADTPENRAQLQTMLQKMLREKCPKTTIVLRDEPD